VVVIRDYRPGDAAGLAALLRSDRPPQLYVPTAAGLEHLFTHLPPRARQRVWIGEEDGSVVAAARASFHWAVEEDGIGRVEVTVLPARRRFGLGSELLGLVEAYLAGHGAWKLDGAVLGDAHGLRFARRHGYTETRRELFSWLEPRPVEVRPPAGARLLPLASLDDRLEEVWRLEMDAVADVPADVPYAEVAFDEWREETLEHPDLDRDGSVFAEIDGHLAAYALVSADREHAVAWNEMTGTAPGFRRRGLARLVKLATIRWAADAGIRAISTGNDAENLGMLALNRELGYRPLLEAVELAKQLSAAGTASARGQGAPAR
jgi:GNAT superfamily N-acetyltransferase